MCRRAASEDESGHSRRADGTRRAHMDSHHERVMTKTNLSGWFRLEAVGFVFLLSMCHLWDFSSNPGLGGSTAFCNEGKTPYAHLCTLLSLDICDTKRSVRVGVSLPALL